MIVLRPLDIVTKNFPREPCMIKKTLYLFSLLCLTHCGNKEPYPRLVDGPAKDLKPSITLEEARQELVLMRKNRAQKKTNS